MITLHPGRTAFSLRERPRWMRPRWACPNHPVYRLERRRRSSSRALRALQYGCLPAILAVAGLAATVILVAFAPRQVTWDVENGIMSILGAFLLILVVIQVLAGAAGNILVVAQTSPLISGEIELQSWGLLRSTTLSLREIVLAKYAATLAHLRSSLAGLMALRLASTVTGLLFVAYLLFRDTYYYDRQAWLHVVENHLWIAPVLAGLVLVLWYLSQPVVQFLLNGVLGVFASSLARSRGRAVATALGVRLAAWVGSIVLNGGMIYGLGWLIIENWADPQSAPIRAFHSLPRPSDEQIAFVISLTAAAYVLTVLAFQSGLIVMGLTLAQRLARRQRA